MKYRVIDHTADFGIHVFGFDPKDLFENAAHALFDVTAELGTVNAVDAIELRIIGDDWQDLMINWLREVLFLWTGKEKLGKFTKILSIKETSLISMIYYEPFFPERHVIKNEIKAVTYHQIEVKEGREGWEAKVIFDV